MNLKEQQAVTLRLDGVFANQGSLGQVVLTAWTGGYWYLASDAEVCMNLEDFDKIC